MSKLVPLQHVLVPAALEVCLLSGQEGKKIIDFVMKARIESNTLTEPVPGWLSYIIDLVVSFKLGMITKKARWDRCWFLAYILYIWAVPKPLRIMTVGGPSVWGKKPRVRLYEVHRGVNSELEIWRVMDSMNSIISTIFNNRFWSYCDF